MCVFRGPMQREGSKRVSKRRRKHKIVTRLGAIMFLDKFGEAKAFEGMSK